MTNLNIECTDLKLKENIILQLDAYMKKDIRLLERGNQQFPVKIVGTEKSKNQDELAKEIAETILFECGNMLNKQANDKVKDNMGLLSPLEAGTKISRLEAKQMYAWGCALVKCENNGMQLSQYGKSQTAVIKSCISRRDTFVEKFNSGGHGIGKTSVDGEQRPKYIKITIKNIDEQTKETNNSSPVKDPSLTSAEMYSYSLLKDSSFKAFPIFLKKLANGAGFAEFIEELGNCNSIGKVDNIALYRAVLDIVKSKNEWNFTKPLRDLELSDKMVKYIDFERKVKTALTENQLNDVKDCLPKTQNNI